MRDWVAIEALGRQCTAWWTMEDISRLTCDAMWLEVKVQREAAAARQLSRLAPTPFLKRGCGPQMHARTLIAAIFTLDISTSLLLVL